MEKKTTLVAFTSPTLRGLVNKVNENGIARSDVFSIQKENNQFVLLYYI